MKNSNNYREMYERMGIQLDKLGCIMLDVDGSVIPEFPEPDLLYTTTHPDRFWIKGFVAGHTPHVTLLYGLLDSGQKIKDHVDTVLADCDISSVEIDHVGFFESPYPDEPYYCIVAHIKLTDELLKAHKHLEFLPHINTFPEYKAHITIAYMKKDEMARNRIITKYNTMLHGKAIPVLNLNYGK